MFMDLGTIAFSLFSWGRQVFEAFTVSFGDITINGWFLLFGGAVVMLVVYFLGRIFQ